MKRSYIQNKETLCLYQLFFFNKKINLNNDTSVKPPYVLPLIVRVAVTVVFVQPK